MLWTWQYRQMDKEMKLWCGETAGRRHAVERVSSRQLAASFCRDAPRTAAGVAAKSSSGARRTGAGRLTARERATRGNQVYSTSMEVMYLLI